MRTIPTAGVIEEKPDQQETPGPIETREETIASLSGQSSIKLRMTLESTSKATLCLRVDGATTGLGIYTVFYDGNNAGVTQPVDTYWQIDSPRIAHPASLTVNRAYDSTHMGPDQPSGFSTPVPERTTAEDTFTFPSWPETRTLVLKFAWYRQDDPNDPRMSMSSGQGGTWEFEIPKTAFSPQGGPPVDRID